MWSFLYYLLKNCWWRSWQMSTMPSSSVRVTTASSLPTTWPRPTRRFSSSSKDIWLAVQPSQKSWSPDSSFQDARMCCHCSGRESSRTSTLFKKDSKYITEIFLPSHPPNKQDNTCSSTVTRRRPSLRSLNLARRTRSSGRSTNNIWTVFAVFGIRT